MSQTLSPQQDKVKTEITKLVDFFSKPNDDLPEYIAETFLKSYGQPSDKWSLNNKIIALANGTRDARTYLQWQQVGRNVKKGEKAFYILAPNAFKVVKENKDNGELEQKTMIAGFKGVAVFPVERTEGKAVKYVEEPKVLPPLYDVAVKMGLKVKYDKTMMGESGSYDQVKDDICLCTADMGTFFHELAHATHKRIDGKLKGGQDTEQEVIAEFTSCVIASLFGYDKKSNSYRYIQSYTKNVGELVLKVLSKVQKIIDYIFSI